MMNKSNQPTDMLVDALTDARNVIEAYEEVLEDHVATIERLERENQALWEALILGQKEVLH